MVGWGCLRAFAPLWVGCSRWRGCPLPPCRVDADSGNVSLHRPVGADCGGLSLVDGLHPVEAALNSLGGLYSSCPHLFTLLFTSRSYNFGDRW